MMHIFEGSLAELDDALTRAAVLANREVAEALATPCEVGETKVYLTTARHVFVRIEWHRGHVCVTVVIPDDPI